jgi:hypothetical protein
MDNPNKKKDGKEGLRGTCGCLTFFGIGMIACYIADTSSGFTGNLFGLICIIGLFCLGYIIIKYLEKM